MKSFAKESIFSYEWHIVTYKAEYVFYHKRDVVRFVRKWNGEQYLRIYKKESEI